MLRGLKLVASAPEASLLPRGGARGFPHWGVWLEVNWRLAATLRRFLVECRGGVASAVATRVTGSPDLVAAAHDEYPGCLAAGRRPAFGLNRVTPADTPSLAAAAAAGVQLEPNPGVAALQKQALAKTLVLAGLLFQGTPLLAEDAVALVGRRFVGEVLRLRAAHADLLAPRPVAAGGEGDEGVELRWYGAHSGKTSGGGGIGPGVGAALMAWRWGRGPTVVALTQDPPPFHYPTPPSLRARLGRGPGSRGRVGRQLCRVHRIRAGRAGGICRLQPLPWRGGCRPAPTPARQGVAPGGGHVARPAGRRRLGRHDTECG